MLFSTLASAHPTSRPVALKLTGAVTLATDRLDVETPKRVKLGGSDSNTEAGTVNVPGATGAWQVKSPTTKELSLLFKDPNEVPVMLT
jgi:hypothetical protein